MQQMNEEELKEVKGGISVTAGIAIVTAVIFLIGVIDGFVHPKSCNE